jgi:hypothetical protein
MDQEMQPIAAEGSSSSKWWGKGHLQQHLPAVFLNGQAAGLYMKRHLQQQQQQQQRGSTAALSRSSRVMKF